MVLAGPGGARVVPGGAERSGLRPGPRAPIAGGAGVCRRGWEWGRGWGVPVRLAGADRLKCRWGVGRSGVWRGVPAGRRTQFRPAARPPVTFGARGDTPARARPRPRPGRGPGDTPAHPPPSGPERTVSRPTATAAHPPPERAGADRVPTDRHRRTPAAERAGADRVPTDRHRRAPAAGAGRSGPCPDRPPPPGHPRRPADRPPPPDPTAAAGHPSPGRPSVPRRPAGPVMPPGWFPPCCR